MPGGTVVGDPDVPEFDPKAHAVKAVIDIVFVLSRQTRRPNSKPTGVSKTKSRGVAAIKNSANPAIGREPFATWTAETKPLKISSATCAATAL